jgi:hypothetical protein
MFQFKDSDESLLVGNEWIPIKDISVIKIEEFIDDDRFIGTVVLKAAENSVHFGRNFSWKEISENFKNEILDSLSSGYINDFNKTHSPGDLVELEGCEWDDRPANVHLYRHDVGHYSLDLTEITSIVFLYWCLDRLCCMITTTKNQTIIAQIAYIYCKILLISTEKNMRLAIFCL